MRCQQSWRCILTIFRQRERNFVENSIFQIYFPALFCTRPIPLAKFEILKYVKLEREFQTFPWFSKISSQKSIIMILFENHIFCIFLHSCNSFQIMKSNPSQSQLNRLAKANHHQAQFKVRNISLEKKPLKLFFFRSALKNNLWTFGFVPHRWK